MAAKKTTKAEPKAAPKPRGAKQKLVEEMAQLGGSAEAPPPPRKRSEKVKGVVPVSLFPIAPARMELRELVRMFYDNQKTRTALANRQSSQPGTAQLSAEHHAFFEKQSQVHSGIETATLKEIERISALWKINDWLRAQRGCGPTMTGVILSEIDIARARHASSLWKLAGLDVQDGKAPRPVKGTPLSYNNFLRTKLVGVLADSFIKSKSPWSETYYGYRQRLNNKRGPCKTCVEKPGFMGAEVCYNCAGKVDDAPWGKSDAHRDRAAKRYMIKMFLMQLWLEWRKLEGLETSLPYAVAKLGMRPHGEA